MAKIKTLKVKAIKIAEVVTEFTYLTDETKDALLKINGSSNLTKETNPDGFELMEWMFEDENETLRYDQIEVTEL